MTAGRRVLLTAAAALAVAAVVVSVAVLPLLREGHLHALRTGGDGDGLRGAFLLWLAACVLTAAALGASLVATLDGPRWLRAARLVVLSVPLAVGHAGVLTALLAS